MTAAYRRWKRIPGGRSCYGEAARTVSKRPWGWNSKITTTKICSIHRCLPQEALLSLVTSLDLTRLDYGNTTLAGLPAILIRRLQSMLNAAARLVLSLRKYDRVTPSLIQQRHWLKVEQLFEYKLAVHVFRCLRGLAPPYLANDIQRVTDLDARRRLRSASTCALVFLTTRLFSVGDRSFPVAAMRSCNSLLDSCRHRRCPRSNVVSKLYVLIGAIVAQLEL